MNLLTEKDEKGRNALRLIMKPSGSFDFCFHFFRFQHVKVMPVKVYCYIKEFSQKISIKIEFREGKEEGIMTVRREVCECQYEYFLLSTKV